MPVVKLPSSLKNYPLYGRKCLQVMMILWRIGLDTIFPPPDIIPHNNKYNIAENALHYNKF